MSMLGALLALTLLAGQDAPGAETGDEVGPTEPEGASIYLQCAGTGTTSTTRFGTTTAIDPATGQAIIANSSVTGRSAIEGQILVDVHEKWGRIFLPRTFLPAVNNGGNQNGWWNFDRLIIGEERIDARFALNALNKPRVTIDRNAGTIRIEGFGNTGFTGVCRVRSSGRQF